MHITWTNFDSACAPVLQRVVDVLYFLNSLAFYTTVIIGNAISRTHPEAFTDVIPWSDAFPSFAFGQDTFEFL